MRSYGRAKVSVFVLLAFVTLPINHPLLTAASSGQLLAHPLAQAEEELKLLWMKYGRDGEPYATCVIGSAVYVVGSSWAKGVAKGVIEARDVNTGELLNSWEHTYGNITLFYDCVVLDAYLYVLGVDNAPGDKEWLILKFTSDLKLIDKRHYNPSNMDEEAWSIVTDGEYLYIGGYDSSNGGRDLQWHLIKMNPSDLSILKSYVSNPSNGWDELRSVGVNPIDGKIWLIGSVNASSLRDVHGRIEVLDKNLSLLAIKDTQNPLLHVVFDEIGFAYIPAPPQWLLKVSPDLQEIDTKPFFHVPDKMIYSAGFFYLAVTAGSGLFFVNALVRTTKDLDSEVTLNLSTKGYDYFFEPVGKMTIANNKLFVAGCAAKSGEKKWVIYSIALTGQAETYTIDFYTEPPNVGSITLAGTTYSNGQVGKYAAGTYPIKANVPQGYIFHNWFASGGISVADPEAQSTTAEVKGNGSITAVFMWYVKLRGTVIRHAEPLYSDEWPYIEIKVEEVLEDTANRIKVGDEIEVYRKDAFVEINDGDRVEIYGLGFWIGFSPGHYVEHGVVIKWPEHYVKKISGKLVVDVWTNKGGRGIGNLSGGIYTTGESAVFYCSISGDASFLKVWMESPNNSVITLFEEFDVKAGTYELKELIRVPEGEWKLKAAACPAGQSCSSEEMLFKDETRYYVRKAGGPRCAVLVTTEPDTPTIDEEVKFTLLISCDNDSEVKEVNLYVDGFLAKRWQGTGTFTFSKKYDVGTHTYHIIIVNQEGQEFRVPAVGEHSFNVLIAEGVAGPPTLRITPFEIVVEYEGKGYRAFYAENISAPDIPPNPNENRAAFYMWAYTKRNWYVLDSNNQVVEDEDVYVKIAVAAETAFKLLVKNPDYLRERTRFFRDVRSLGTQATFLKILGKQLAGFIPAVALGSAIPSSAGVERFGSIIKFTSLVKKAEPVTDVDLYITLVADVYLRDAENALLRASELAEPVYKELMSDPSRPKAHVKYPEMLELYELTKKEAEGFAGMSMLYQLHKGGMESYIGSVIKAILESPDPTGLSAVAFKIQESPEVREFFDQMCAWEAEQHIRDDAFERGARSFAKAAREYAEIVKRGDSGGVVTVREGKIVSFETASGVEIKGEIQNRKIVLIVSSNAPKGKIIMIDLDSRSLPITKIEEVIVVFDGERIEMADNLADVLNPNDDEKPEYFLLWGSKGAQVLISIPSFSAHTIEIIHRPSIQGDVNSDGLVDYKDLAIVVARYGSRRGDPSYLDAADVNLDGVIDYKDLAVVVSHYGES